ncbi:MAG: T9SS type A sorting domain-containing protein [Bacteroidales bacterium]
MTRKLKKIQLFQLALYTVLISLSHLNSFCQLNTGGIPFTVKYKLSTSGITEIKIQEPDIKLLETEDSAALNNGSPFRYAVNLPVHIDLINPDYSEELSNGDQLYRIKFTVTGALALSCYFNDFYIPEGGLLYVFNNSKQIIGGYTSINNQGNGFFATELIQGESLFIEYYEPSVIKGLSRLQLSELSYAYRGVRFNSGGDNRGFGGSGACEVNINCPEGQNWQIHKHAIMRIAVKIGSSSYWCTGTLLNNVNQDFKPYVLTADHCGSLATQADLSQWVFYFNYEGLDCPDPVLEPGSKTLTGAVKKASSGGGGSQIKESDLYLVLLNNTVPAAYNPYFSGWNRLNNPSSSGVCIHHPQGDIKKISTYTTPTVSSSWGSTPGSHWSVKWSQTQSGHGVTEPGSSGSPLFNTQGEVIGQLSGGESSCSNLTASDLYGKFSYSWQPAGADSSKSLHYWLDPLNTGSVNIPGISPTINYIVANFSADQDTFIVGNSVNFIDLSYGNPTSWKWTLEGGTPENSTEQHPKNIAYNKTGVFKVSLVASNDASADTVEKKRYITVLPNIFPVPFNKYINIDFGSQPEDNPVIEIYDILGRQVKFLLHEDNPGTRFSVYLKNPVPGVYYLNVMTSGLKLSKKILFIKTE